MFCVRVADWALGTKSDPIFFTNRDEARDYAIPLVEGWRQGSDQIRVENGWFLVISESGLLDFGAIITEVP